MFVRKKMQMGQADINLFLSGGASTLMCFKLMVDIWSITFLRKMVMKRVRKSFIF
jgi:hypothetical protein